MDLIGLGSALIIDLVIESDKLVYSPSWVQKCDISKPLSQPDLSLNVSL